MPRDNDQATGSTADPAPNNDGNDSSAPRDIKMSPFIAEADPDETGRRWGKWKNELLTRFRYFRISSVVDRTDAIQIYGGEQLRELIESLPDVTQDAGGERNQFEKILDKLDHHFQPMVNPDSARSKFEGFTQNEGESVAQYYVRLRIQAAKCAFIDMNDALRSKLLHTMRDGKLRREAMLKRYSLQELLKNAANKEDIYRQAIDIEKSHQHDKQEAKSVHSRRQPQKKTRAKPSRKAQASSHENNGSCNYCGLSHDGGKAKCTAVGKTCRICSKTGHFARVCRSKGKSPRKSGPSHDKADQAAHKVGESSHYFESSSSESEFVFKVRSNLGTPTVPVKINGIKGLMEADSCSTANIIDENRFHAINNALKQKLHLTPSHTKLYAYAQDQPIPLLGSFSAEIESLSTGKRSTANFLVAKGETKSRPLLSLATSVELGILHVVNTAQPETLTQKPVTSKTPVNQIVDEFSDVFTGLGKHKKIKAKLIVDEEVQPIVHKQRSIPYNLREKAKLEEQRLLKLGIVEKVPDNQPTTWCTNPVIAPKPHNPEAIRYCSDMRAPNTAIKRPITDALTVEDLKFKLEGASTFSVLDMNEGYHQIILDEDSRHLTTFYGAECKLRFTRLNFGTISAQDIFDRAMSETIEGLSGVLHIRDDFIVYGKDDDDHDKALRELLARFRENGLTFNPKKCKFSMKEIEFFGLVFSSQGVKPAASKVEALKAMDPPKNPTEVRSLLGMAQYSAQFIKNFSEITAPLRRLTHKGTPWRWSETEQKAFEDLKKSLSSDTVIGYYEIGLETKLQVDASPNGLGLLLQQKKSHGWQTVACASRSLTPVEQRYSQLEREALAIRWGCERCYKYLIGSTFIVETDHKPLLPLFNQPNSMPPLRLERWLMYLQQFDFKLVYRPGSDNPADYLSRHAMSPERKELRNSHHREEVVKQLIHDTTPKAISLAEIQQETKADEDFSTLVTYIQNGNKRSCKNHPELRKYSQIFDELCLAEGIILRGNRIVLPPSLQDRAVNICHEGHLGIVKTKQLLRSKVWFPGIDKMVESRIGNCIPCQASVGKSKREPLRMTPLPKGPWLQASADFCGPFPSGELAQLLIDNYSRYPEVEIILSTSAESTIPAFEKMFATHGVPEILKTDNGPPFQSSAFARFAKMKGFKHQKVTPLWPEANGEAENFMKNLGKVAKTAWIEGKDWKQEVYTFLGNYRSTPHPSTGKSPYELSMNRDVRGKIPTIPKEQSKNSKHEDVIKKDNQAKKKMKTDADLRRKTRPHKFNVGDVVLVKQNKRNKSTSYFEATPYVIQDIKDSMITSSRITDDRPMTRNSSHYKKLNVNQSLDELRRRVTRPQEDVEDIAQDSTEDLESDVLQAAPDQQSDSADRIDNQRDAPEEEQPTSVVKTRSGRASRSPVWLKDYVC